MPENRERELIYEAGMKYVGPINSGSYVRVMPGKPHSPYPYQQQPYASQMKDGNMHDKYGDIVSTKAPAHIPLSEFIYRN